MTLSINNGDGHDSLETNQLVASLDGTGWVSGCATSLTTPASTTAIEVSVQAGTVAFDSSDQGVTAATVSLSGGHADYPRKDVVYADTTGTVQVAEGIPSPARPTGESADGTPYVAGRTYRPEPSSFAPDSTGSVPGVPLAEVWVPAHRTSTQDLLDYASALGIDSSRLVRDRRVAASRETVPGATYVTKDTAETITGLKTFTADVTLDAPLRMGLQPIQNVGKIEAEVPAADWVTLFDGSGGGVTDPYTTTFYDRGVRFASGAVGVGTVLDMRTGGVVNAPHELREGERRVITSTDATGRQIHVGDQAPTTDVGDDGDLYFEY